MDNQITYLGWTFEGDDILEGCPYSEQSLPNSALGVDTIRVRIRCGDPSIVHFQRNTPMIYKYRGRQRGIYYVQSIQRVGPDRYDISGTSALGLLEQMEHRGGMYTGETVEEVVRDICGSIPVHIKSILSPIQLYGWLPYCKPPQASARDNLAQVLFAIGAYLGTDLDGYLRVEPLWDGVAGAVPPDRIYTGASVEYEASVSMVSVTEHQYLKGTEVTTLFDGTAASGDVVTFSDPMHDLQAEGFTILDSGPNWARLSAGTGTLTGVGYVHVTRQITEIVSSDAAENVKSVSDCTLVSLVNSRAVATRMADYYRCNKTLSIPIAVQHERPGQVVSIYDPFDRNMVEACIASMDVNMSHILRGETKALAGFVPPQPEAAEYYDYREVLTGTGRWQRPEDVTLVTGILISGAQGGKAGKKGSSGAARSYSFTSTSLGISYRVNGYGPGPGGAGGEGGEPGSGGKIFRFELNVSDMDAIDYACGVGGHGAVYRGDGSEPEGGLGGSTTFGPMSSDQGSTDDAGYQDIVTGEVYGARGEPGIPGGNGGGLDDASIDGQNIMGFTPAGNVADEAGTVWTTGAVRTVADQPDRLYSEGDEALFGDSLSMGIVSVRNSAELSGGAAAGQNSADGSFSVLHYVERDKTQNKISGYASSPGGKDGASATLIPKKAANGNGGRGGYGGGGGSSIGYSFVSIGGNPVGTVDVKANTALPGVGGDGCDGGDGSDGLIILYYRKPKIVQRGATVTRDEKWLLDTLGRRMIV